MKRLLFVILTLVITASFVYAEDPPQYLMQWGSYGSNLGQFNTPTGIAVGVTGDVYVVDSGNNRVEQFTAQGVFIRTWGSLGSDNGQFNSPFGIAVDQSGYVYVCDRNNFRVQKFTGDGHFVLKWGVYGIDYPYQFTEPNGISVAPDGTIFVAQGTRYGYLQRWTNDGGLLWYQSSGSAQGVCAAPNGKVSFSFPTCRIQVYLPSLEADYGSCGTRTDQMAVPLLMCSDANNNTYVAEQGNARIHKFTQLGQHLTMWGINGTGDGEFRGPEGVAISNNGIIYVTDTNNHRIQVFGDPATPTNNTTWGRLKSLFR